MYFLLTESRTRNRNKRDLRDESLKFVEKEVGEKAGELYIAVSLSTIVLFLQSKTITFLYYLTADELLRSFDNREPGDNRRHGSAPQDRSVCTNVQFYTHTYVHFQCLLVQIWCKSFLVAIPSVQLHLLFENIYYVTKTSSWTRVNSCDLKLALASYSSWKIILH